jgi:DNA modification methylase
MSLPEPYYADESVTLHLGDALEVLAAMEAGSVSAIITDPPYGLEFMGKDWDAPWQERDINADAGFAAVGMADGGHRLPRPTFTGSTNPKCLNCKGTRRGRKDGTAIRAVCTCENPRFPNIRATEMQAFQDWCEQWATECLRILKPGGHLLAFGGTRTWHRLTCAIEDAGFEIRDSVADLTGIDGPGLLWMYGCLTADAEILTEYGWRPGIEVTARDRVAQWNAATGTVSLAPVEQTFRAPWDGPLRVLRNADTDQLLTPNHRVYHQPRRRRMTSGARRAWYDDRWEAAEAGTLSTWNSVRLPIAGQHDGPGIGGEDYAALLGWVWTEGGFDLSGAGVRIYQSSVNAAKVAEIAALMDRLGPHKRYDYQRTYDYTSGRREYTATTWFFSGELAARVRGDLPGKRPTYPLLWRMASAEKRAFLRAAMLGDGSGYGTRSEQFYQQHEDDLIWFQTLLALIGRSGKVTMRSNRRGGSVALRQRGTTELQARHLRNSVENYTGEVWCVRVPTGAFIARRAGRVFITGNSGFPKSLDVSKAIDKRPGVSNHRAFAAHLAQRRVTLGLSRADVSERIVGSRTGACWNWEHHQFPEAKWWPALSALLGLDPQWGAVIAEAERETIGKRTTGIGTGGGTVRVIADGENRDITAPATEDAARWEGWGTALKPAWEPIVVARKPLAGPVAASVLEHGTGALNISGCRVDPGVPVPGGGGLADGAAPHDAGRWPANAVLGETAAAELDRQSGTVAASGRYAKGSRSIGPKDGAASIPLDGLTSPQYTDTGGASRFFPVFRYEAKAGAAERPRLEDGTAHPTVKPVDLMAWLVRLVTPPGGLVLDPFAGSGTTAEACIVEGFRCLLVEKDPKSAELIRERLRKDIQPTMFGGAA